MHGKGHIVHIMSTHYPWDYLIMPGVSDKNPIVTWRGQKYFSMSLPDTFGRWQKGGGIKHMYSQLLYVYVLESTDWRPHEK